MKHRYTLTALSKSLALVFLISLLSAPVARAQDYSVAHEWSEVMLNAIRDDFARPTVHARNLWHVSTVMYDAWAVYDDTSAPFFLGNSVGGFEVPFDCVSPVEDTKAAQEEALSYAAYRLLMHRFSETYSPGFGISQFRFGQLMEDLGYDVDFTSTDYQNDGPAALGNYLGEMMIQFGYQDGANELDAEPYSNLYYEVSNPDLQINAIIDDEIVFFEGNPDLVNPNNWQQLILFESIDQSGEEGVNTFLSPEWGDCVPFSLTEEDKTTYTNTFGDFQVWKDPGAPPYIDGATATDLNSLYGWGFNLVAIWSAHLDPADEVMWDISPASIGNIQYEDLPTSLEDYDEFYNLMDGGDASQGWDYNPVTGEPYEPQMVRRGDYARVLAEFWADGPDSETPPGHWFTLVNYVNYHPELDKRWKGEGPVVDDLEWDVKSYFTLGGTMHDAAVSAWSIKGWYDYIRPVSAIRWMAQNGQCTDTEADNYHIHGLPIVPGYIEVIEMGDPLAGDANENVGRMKINGWRGPEFIQNPFIDVAGVGWILAEKWLPYQRPTFVTPPFAGYVSGHSTFSRAAAEAVTLMTGTPFFPGGMGIFDCEQNQFLVFEDGPSEFLELQWATYQDASDQCSLSRIWGGIHPPADDIPGRLIGYDIGHQAFALADSYFNPDLPRVEETATTVDVVNDAMAGMEFTISATYNRLMDVTVEPELSFTNTDPSTTLMPTGGSWDNAYTYTWTSTVMDANEELSGIHAKIVDAVSLEGDTQMDKLLPDLFTVDTANPSVVSASADDDVVNDASTGEDSFFINIMFDEAMDMTSTPSITWPMEDASIALTHDTEASAWTSEDTYNAVFDVMDSDMDLDDIDLGVVSAMDAAGNMQVEGMMMDNFSIRQRNALVTGVTVSDVLISDLDESSTVTIDVEFDELMVTGIAPTIAFTNADPSASLVWDEVGSMWLDPNTYSFVFTAADVNETLTGINVEIIGASDQDGNDMVPGISDELLSVDTENPVALSISPSTDWVTDEEVGAGGFSLTVVWSEPMNTTILPEASSDQDPSATLAGDLSLVGWLSDTEFEALFDVSDGNEEILEIAMTLSLSEDAAGNIMEAQEIENVFSIDNLNPEVTIASANTYVVGDDEVGTAGFSILVLFSEAMDTDVTPDVSFPAEDAIAAGLTANAGASGWLNDNSYEAAYDVASDYSNLADIDVEVSGADDSRGNPMDTWTGADFFDIDNGVGVEELDLPVTGVFPNPVNAGENFAFVSQVNADFEVQVMDGAGKLVFQNIIPSTTGDRVAVSTAGWAAGTYVVSLGTDDWKGAYRVEVVR